MKIKKKNNLSKHAMITYEMRAVAIYMLNRILRENHADSTKKCGHGWIDFGQGRRKLYTNRIRFDRKVPSMCSRSMLKFKRRFLDWISMQDRRFPYGGELMLTRKGRWLKIEVARMEKED